MDVGFGDSDWFRKRFGDAGPSVARALLTAGREAHDRSSDTKAASGLMTNEPYGATFWQVLALEIVEELSGVQGIGTSKPKGARYALPVVNGTTIHAVKCASRSGSHHDRLKIRWSQFRDDSMLSVERVKDEVLPLEEWLNELDDEGIEAPTSAKDAVVLAAFVASADGGLQHIYVGDGYIDRNDDVHWVRHEEVPVRVEVADLIGTGSVVADRFDSAPGNADLSLGLVAKPVEGQA